MLVVGDVADHGEGALEGHAERAKKLLEDVCRGVFEVKTVRPTTIEEVETLVRELSPLAFVFVGHSDFDEGANVPAQGIMLAGGEIVSAKGLSSAVESAEMDLCVIIACAVNDGFAYELLKCGVFHVITSQVKLDAKFGNLWIEKFFCSIVKLDSVLTAYESGEDALAGVDPKLRTYAFSIWSNHATTMALPTLLRRSELTLFTDPLFLLGRSFISPFVVANCFIAIALSWYLFGGYLFWILGPIGIFATSLLDCALVRRSKAFSSLSRLSGFVRLEKDRWIRSGSGQDECGRVRKIRQTASAAIDRTPTHIKQVTCDQLARRVWFRPTVLFVFVVALLLVVSFEKGVGEFVLPKPCFLNGNSIVKVFGKSGEQLRHFGLESQAGIPIGIEGSIMLRFDAHPRSRLRARITVECEGDVVVSCSMQGNSDQSRRDATTEVPVDNGVCVFAYLLRQRITSSGAISALPRKIKFHVVLIDVFGKVVTQISLDGQLS